MDTQPPPSTSPPSSPGAQPVKLQDCIELILRFTLDTSNSTGLSPEYCAKLLKHDPFDLVPTSNEVSEGFPSYPLYKHLALALYQSIRSGALCTQNKEVIPVPEDSSSKNTEDEWNKLILKKGQALLSMLKEVDFELHVQEPFFSQLNEGLKTVEGRCASGDYKRSYFAARIQSGDLLLFNKCLILQVQDIHQYATFHEMLEAESLEKVLPGVRSIKEGVQIYRNFYSEEKESANGVLGICVIKPTSQLCDIMASLLSGLSYGGVQRLLGFVQTTGTNPGLLPPPTSTLLATFLAPHNPDAKGSTLTTGARALAKHANRSTEAYWGSLRGSESDKNKHALDTVARLLTTCSWLNMHIVPPHGIVFELRTADGYGARWSKDGTKFIGFLEPYMVDGHSKRWKH